MSRANSDIMDTLHGMVADGLKQELERAMKATDELGNPLPMNPQLFDKAMKFLKDNGIDAPKQNAKVDSLAGVLADLDLDLDETAIGMAN